MKKAILKVMAAGVWITFSEFLRNEILFKHLWVSHFDGLGLSFQTKPVNGIFWMLWSFILAYIIFKLSNKFSFRETFVLTWLPAFLMMWIVIYNLQVLPMKLLVFAIPLSLIEVVVAEIIIRKM